MILQIAPEILGIGIIVAVAGGAAAVWYLRKKGKRESAERLR